MNKLYRAILPIVIAVMFLSACAPAATPTQAPAAPAATSTTAAVEPTVAPTATTAAAEPTVAPTAAVTDTPAAAAVTDTPVPTPTVTPLASKEGTLTIWTDAARVKVVTELAKQFTAKYNVPVAVQEMGFGDIRNQLKIAGPAGEGADIIVGAHDWLGELVSNGLLEPIDLGDKAKSFDPVSLQAFSYNGKLYGMPYGVEAVALIYNKDLVPTPPATWEELKTIAKKLQDDKKVDQGYVLQQADAYHFEPMLSGFGGYIFGKNPDGSYNPKDLGFDNAGATAAAQELDSMVKAGLIRKDVTYDIMASLFKEGKSAMMFGGPWMLADIKAAKINYGIAPLPKMKVQPRPFVGVQGFMVSAFGKNKLLAQSFLKEYMATDEAMKMLYDAEPRGPAWIPLRDKLDDPDLKAFAASAATGDPMPAIPEMSAVWEADNKAITLIFQQQQAPDQAMKDAAKTIRDKIASTAK